MILSLGHRLNAVIIRFFFGEKRVNGVGCHWCDRSYARQSVDESWQPRSGDRSYGQVENLSYDGDRMKFSATPTASTP